MVFSADIVHAFPNRDSKTCSNLYGIIELLRNHYVYNHANVTVKCSLITAIIPISCAQKPSTIRFHRQS